MERLRGTSCYLVGPIEHDEGFGADWRDVVCGHMNQIGVTVYNPLDRPAFMRDIEDYVPPNVSRQDILKRIGDGDDRFSRAQAMIRRICIRYVGTCDFVVCYLPNKKTFGSTEELVIASNLMKPIIVVYPDGCPSLWIYDVLKDAHVFEDLKDSMKFLSEINDGTIEVDPIEWVFLQEK